MELRTASQSEMQDMSQKSLLEVNGNPIATDEQLWRNGKRHHTRHSSWLAITLIAVGLLVTTVLSLLLLIASVRHWTFPERLYLVVVQNRASVQLVIQALSNTFALIWVSLICVLVNYASRIYFNKHAVELDTLRLWHGICSRSMKWNLPLQSLLVLLLFIGITAVPSALWAGALTPIGTTVQREGGILLPGYANKTNIKEWPSEIRENGPSLRSSLGFFTYSVGINMQASLLASASAATPVDGSIRQHAKLDNTHFSYHGRSYGIGASVGLTDTAILSDSLHLNYSYLETGYKTGVSCAYNKSSDFTIIPDGGGSMYAATGELPNSTPGDPEYSVYVGHGTSAIVAIGVARNWTYPSRMLGIAAGHSYAHLNKIQCSLDFEPTLFHVNVSIDERNITVTPLYGTANESSYNTGNLTYTLTRQFELIANDQTSLYSSLVGNSLNASIGDYITAHSAAEMSLRQATPPALENAFEAMVDDMLVAYASAQIMITDQSEPLGVTIIAAAVRVGEDIYIRAVFGINVIVLLLVCVEAVRTKVWRRLGSFDYMDPADLVVGAVLSRSTDEDLAAPRTLAGRDVGKVKFALKSNNIICLA